jgi:hypothetical protein
LIPGADADYSRSMKRFFLPLLVVTLTLLSAQAGAWEGQDGGTGPAPEAPAEEASPEEAGGFKPPALTLILEGIRQGEPLWRPDWPPDFPPDAFRLQRGEYRSLSVKQEDEEFRFSREAEGEAQDFPLFVEGAFVQGKLFYDEASRLRGIGAGGWDLEILAYEEGLPSLSRMKTAEGWYFTGLKRRGNSIFETWYDESGGIVSLWVYETIPLGEGFRIVSREPLFGPERGSGSRYYFENRGLLSAVETGEARVEALYYREGFPRYRGEKNAGGERRFSLQWDEEGFLARISLSAGLFGTGAPSPGPAAGEKGEEKPAEGAAEKKGEEAIEGPVEHRYEYTLDEKGNWIERREILMFRRRGLLVPSPGELIIRSIEYGASE